MSKIYFISDLHLGHANIIKYCDRPFGSVEEMDREIIARWNDTIKSDDLVYDLGDFCFGDKKDVLKYTEQLNGRHFLICGNHDRYSPKEYMELGFEWAARFPILYAKYGLLSHEPQFLEENSIFFNAYGHTHTKIYSGKSPNYFNCCVEQLDYRPIQWEEMLERIETKLPSAVGEVNPK